MMPVPPATGRPRILAVSHIPLDPNYPNGFCERSHEFFRALGAEAELELLLVSGIWFDGPAEAMRPPSSVHSAAIHLDRAVPVAVADGAQQTGVAAAFRHFTSTATLASPRQRSAVLDAVVQSRHYDLVVFLMHYTAHYAHNLPASLPCLFVLEEGDERQLLSNAYGSEAVPPAWYRRLWRRLYWQPELARYRAFYALLGRRGPVVAINEEEKAWFARSMPADRITVIPLGVDCQKFAPLPPVEDYDLAVFAALDHRRNYEPALALFEALANIGGPPLRWLFVGPKPHPAIRALASGDVTVTGEVPDTRPYYPRAKLVVVPAQSGAGTKTTILKAWAMQRPVVTTPHGLRGLPARPGDNLAVGRDIPAMAREVLRLLAAPAERAALAESGRRTATTERTLERSGAEFLALCRRVIGSVRL